MIDSTPKMKHRVVYRTFSAILSVIFMFGVVFPPYIAEAQVLPTLPLPGAMVVQSPGYVPALIKGITIHPENPLAFNFIIDTGDSGINVDSREFKDESLRLVKYFLASLTVPAHEMWVNLSPYEKDRIMPQSFGLTEMGMNLLAQDYMLKQLTASLMYPEEGLGKKFWDRVYERAHKEFGTKDIPVNSFHKVWIIPEDALVYEKGNQAFVVRNKLKVMMEEDYFAMRNNQTPGHQDTKTPEGDQLTQLQTEVMREVVLPEIEKEVNEGENFAQLRQIFQSMVLATWFKKNLKESLLGQVYADQNKVRGVDTDDPAMKEKIYQQYLKAFEQGVYNYIREDVDPQTHEIIPRNYFSGGAYGGNMPGVQRTIVAGSEEETSAFQDEAMLALTPSGKIGDVDVNLTESEEEAALRQAQAAQGQKPGDEAMMTQDTEKMTSTDLRQLLRQRVDRVVDLRKELKDASAFQNDVERLLEEGIDIQESLLLANQLLFNPGSSRDELIQSEKVLQEIHSRLESTWTLIDPALRSDQVSHKGIGMSPLSAQIEIDYQGKPLFSEDEAMVTIAPALEVPEGIFNSANKPKTEGFVDELISLILDKRNRNTASDVKLLFPGSDAYAISSDGEWLVFASARTLDGTRAGGALAVYHVGDDGKFILVREQGIKGTVERVVYSKEKEAFYFELPNQEIQQITIVEQDVISGASGGQGRLLRNFRDERAGANERMAEQFRMTSFSDEAMLVLTPQTLPMVLEYLENLSSEISDWGANFRSWEFWTGTGGFLLTATMEKGQVKAELNSGSKNGPSAVFYVNHDSGQNLSPVSIVQLMQEVPADSVKWSNVPTISEEDPRIMADFYLGDSAMVTVSDEAWNNYVKEASKTLLKEADPVDAMLIWKDIFTSPLVRKEIGISIAYQEVRFPQEDAEKRIKNVLSVLQSKEFITEFVAKVHRYDVGFENERPLNLLLALVHTIATQYAYSPTDDGIASPALSQKIPGWMEEIDDKMIETFLHLMELRRNKDQSSAVPQAGDEAMVVFVSEDALNIIEALKALEPVEEKILFLDREQKRTAYVTDEGQQYYLYRTVDAGEMQKEIRLVQPSVRHHEDVKRNIIIYRPGVFTKDYFRFKRFEQDPKSALEAVERQVKKDRKHGDQAMLTEVAESDVDAALKYWRSRAKGISATQPIPGDFRESVKEDVFDITEVSEEEGLRLERIGALEVLKGKGMGSALIAGASSRMNVKRLPDEARALAGDHVLTSKAEVPVAKVNGEAKTYLDIVGENFALLLEQLKQEARSAGIPEKVDGNKLLFMTNNDSIRAHQELIKKKENFGLNEDQIRLFVQPKGPKFYATPRDIEQLIDFGKITENADIALAKAKEIESSIKSNKAAVIVPDETSPLGHGDYLHYMVKSGELLRMFDEGLEWGFVRNIDNNAAKFDKVFLRELGYFIENGIDFMPEVSPRAPGQVGGSLVVRPDGTHVIAEDPNLRASLDADGHMKADPAKNYWMNSAVAFFTRKYVAVSYMTEDQTVEEFVEEMRSALGDEEAMDRIVARGKNRSLALIDPKESDKEKGVYIAKRETNMWMSTAVVDSNKVKVRAIGVKGSGNLDVNKYLDPNTTEEERSEILAEGRFLATKQWGRSPEDKEKIKQQTTAAFMADPQIGRAPTREELRIRYESYKGNKLITDGYLDYIYHHPLVTPGLLTGTDEAMLTVQEKQGLILELLNSDSVEVHSSVGTDFLKADFFGTDGQHSELFIHPQESYTLILLTGETNEIEHYLLSESDAESIRDHTYTYAYNYRMALDVLLEELRQKDPESDDGEPVEASEIISYLKGKKPVGEFAKKDGTVQAKFRGADGRPYMLETFNKDNYLSVSLVEGVGNEFRLIRESSGWNTSELNIKDDAGEYNYPVLFEILEEPLLSAEPQARSVGDQAMVTERLLADLKRQTPRFEKVERDGTLYTAEVTSSDGKNYLIETHLNKKDHLIIFFYSANTKEPRMEKVYSGWNKVRGINVQDDNGEYIYQNIIDVLQHSFRPAEKFDGDQAMMSTGGFMISVDSVQAISELQNNLDHNDVVYQDNGDWSVSLQGEKGSSRFDVSPRAGRMTLSGERNDGKKIDVQHTLTEQDLDGAGKISFDAALELFRQKEHEVLSVRRNDPNAGIPARAYAGDEAMGTRAQEPQSARTLDKGGIDLNPEFLDLKIKRDGQGIPLPMPMQSIDQLREIEGFLPVIINVTPIQNLPMLLGLGDIPTKEDDNRLSQLDAVDKLAKLD